MSTEEIGFATGIFRNLMLEEYAFPVYVLDKEKIRFTKSLESNFQFKTLFKRAWNRWDICVHPTYTGFFVIRLTQKYKHRPRSVLTWAREVLRLQESLDVLSAQRWLEHNKERYLNEPETLKKKERSVKALLEWMGADEEENKTVLYAPVQWKMAMEIAGFFVNEIGQYTSLFDIDEKPIRFQRPQTSISLPLHDAYVIHHIDEMFSDPRNVKKAKKSKAQGNAQIKVSVHNIRQSPRLRQRLVNLMEGTVLRKPGGNGKCEDDDCYFPDPSWTTTDSVSEINRSSWNDELCLLSSRTAILFPSMKWRDFEMAVSTMPGATLKVKYARYWGAIERMIEFVLEIRVLAQLVDSASFDLLGEVAEKVHKVREQLIEGDIILDKSFIQLVSKAAHLRRLAALAQSMTNPHLWSRAEYAIRKSEYLFEELGVPTTLMHVERNIDSINSVVDHVDELYIADLSEKSNDQATLFSIGLAAGSLILTFLVFPSFLADTVSIYIRDTGETLHWTGWLIAIAGGVLALSLIYFAMRLLKVAFVQRKKVNKLLDKFMNDSEME
ncbi:MAG: hypothetical protein HN736_07735 [Anaerolineae bacterium]|nr:hypothetical protein [Anaerolineae bacterium]MBT4457300.1 hypothetical protein [Anaerolineae bacterium]MBT6062005.1 hypothetical protein [Anaerolineae bacterium]MBT6322031.1 hypothetical protein [Anaerolineae bacterium]MBT6814021.1 hypothetical protein [Anaerolineae bacterium]